MTRAVGNGMIQTLANAIGTGAVGKLAKQVAGLSADAANIKSPEKGSGLMFNPDTGKLYIPCGNGVTVNKNTGMLEVPIGDNLRYTAGGLDVPDADETTAGVVKLTHEVSNRDDGQWAITADGVYADAPDKKNVDEFISPTRPELIDVSNGASIYRGLNTLQIYNLHIYGSLFVAITLPPSATAGEPWAKYVTLPEAYRPMNAILVVGSVFRDVVNLGSFFMHGTVADYNLTNETKILYTTPSTVKE